jgi:hypothetical protein
VISDQANDLICLFDSIKRNLKICPNPNHQKQVKSYPPGPKCASDSNAQSDTNACYYFPTVSQLSQLFRRLLRHHGRSFLVREDNVFDRVWSMLEAAGIEIGSVGRKEEF